VVIQTKEELEQLIQQGARVYYEPKKRRYRLELLLCLNNHTDAVVKLN
jgi:hypothetical protein